MVDYRELMGDDVSVVHNGVRGLEKALVGDVHAVILDVMMPHMDEFDVLKRLRKGSDIPVLMLKARREDTDLEGNGNTVGSAYLYRFFGTSRTDFRPGFFRAWSSLSAITRR